jgi:uncharacterized protein YbaR (Trm112 family)
MVIEKPTVIKILIKVGLNKTAWALRKLFVPVDKNALVLDVGSGGNPYPRANVLIDAYEDTIERHHAPLIADRPMVYGTVEKLPFKNKTFDFIIASHVLEHMAEPDKMLSELQRVGKAGYIETPDAFMEMICPYTFHRLEVTDIDDKLYITKKPSWCHRKELVDRYSNKMKNDPAWFRYLTTYPESTYTCFYWVDKIDYLISNPEVDATWPLMVREKKFKENISIHTFLLKAIRYLFTQRSRNRSINLMALLQCPTCGNDDLVEESEGIRCNLCNSIYSIKNGMPVMFPCHITR